MNLKPVANPGEGLGMRWPPFMHLKKRRQYYLVSEKIVDIFRRYKPTELPTQYISCMAQTKHKQNVSKAFRSHLLKCWICKSPALCQLEEHICRI